MDLEELLKSHAITVPLCLSTAPICGTTRPKLFALGNRHPKKLAGAEKQYGSGHVE